MKKFLLLKRIFGCNKQIDQLKSSKIKPIKIKPTQNRESCLNLMILNKPNICKFL